MPESGLGSGGGFRRVGLRGKLRQFLPEKLAPVDNLAAAHMEKIDGEHAILVMVTVDVRIVVVRGRHALSFLYLAHGDEQIPVLGREFELLGSCSRLHALFE